MHHVTVSCDPPYSNSVGAGGGACAVLSHLRRVAEAIGCKSWFSSLVVLAVWHLFRRKVAVPVPVPVSYCCYLLLGPVKSGGFQRERQYWQGWCWRILNVVGLGWERFTHWIAAVHSRFLEELKDAVDPLGHIIECDIWYDADVSGAGGFA